MLHVKSLIKSYNILEVDFNFKVFHGGPKISLLSFQGLERTYFYSYLIRPKNIDFRGLNSGPWVDRNLFVF